MKVKLASIQISKNPLSLLGVLLITVSLTPIIALAQHQLEYVATTGGALDVLESGQEATILCVGGVFQTSGIPCGEMRPAFYYPSGGLSRYDFQVIQVSSLTQGGTYQITDSSGEFEPRGQVYDCNNQFATGSSSDPWAVVWPNLDFAKARFINPSSTLHALFEVKVQGQYGEIFTWTVSVNPAQSGGGPGGCPPSGCPDY